VDSFFETPEGRLVQHRRRERRRILIYLDDVEPQSKKMVDADKDAFQRRWYAQRALLARSRLNTAHLCWLMGRRARSAQGDHRAANPYVNYFALRKTR
jgi:hypothetical protein